MLCTYNFRDDKLRLYPSERLPQEEYNKLKELKFQWAPKQECFYSHWTPNNADAIAAIYGEIEPDELTPEERAAVRSSSPVGAKYDTPINRESAYEILNRRAAAKQPEPTGPFRTQPEKPQPKSQGMVGDLLWGTGRRQGMVETLAKQAARTVGSQLGRQILRGVLGGILGASRR